jgi:hypothetical protein
MNSTTSNVMPEAAQQPETPIVEARPVLQETDTSERVRAMHPGAELGWSNHGGMVEQQASAMEWVRASSEQPSAGEGESGAQERSAAVEMTDSRQAQSYSRWTGEPLGETAGVTQSAGQGQSH